jgi:hypothetical protein
MKSTHPLRSIAAALFLAALGVSTTALAVNLKTVVAPIYQVGTGSMVRIGHTAVASTTFNQLYAGGTYQTSCGGPGIVPMSGQNFLSAWNLIGGLQLYVTIPEVHPATISMPGFYESATRGHSINCAYNWTSRAIESGYSISAAGISYQIGNGERSEGGAQPFIMKVPSTTDPNDGGSCIP